MKSILALLALFMCGSAWAQTTPFVLGANSTFNSSITTPFMTNAAGGGGVNLWFTNSASGAGSRAISSTTAWTAKVNVTQSGKVDMLELYVANYTSTANVVMGLYGTDSVTLLGQCNAVACSGTGWLVGTMTATVSVSSGNYYVGYLSSTSVDDFEFSIDGTSASGADNGLTYPTLPAPFVNVFSSQANTDAGIHLQ